MSIPGKKVCLVCIDGWGLSDQVDGNAIKNANTPNMDNLQTNQLFASLDASGLAVGLPEGVMGNSEVGHLTIGAGQREFQDLVKINLTIKNGKLPSVPALVEAFDKAKQGNGRLHFLGLVSNGGVHSHIDHLLAFLDCAKAAGVPQTFVQFFSDGRDTDPKSGLGFIRQLQSHLDAISYGSIATVMGRFYAMDRDKRWERVEVAFNGLVNGVGEETTKDGLAALVEARYATGDAKQTDEFFTPIIVNREGLVKEGDVLVFIDFRADRMREIVEVFGFSKIPGSANRLPSQAAVPDVHLFQMTQYNSQFPFPILFPPQKLENVLAEWIAKKGLVQFHTAETEKYAHVTFFFNGGREAAFEGEERAMVPSPKHVATYDLAPEMNAAGVTDSLIQAIAQNKYPFVMCNFAPPDMVGHTGSYEAALVAVACTDVCIGRLWEACQQHGYALMITADHGNAELMTDATGKPVTSHSTNPVPFIIAGAGENARLTRSAGGLEDVAPTVLTVMGLDIPPQMTGSSMVAYN